MAKHQRLASSQTKWWANCPGALAWVEAHPELESPSGFHAQMGTSAHAIVERCLDEGSEPSDYRGRLVEIIDPGGDEGTSILKAGAKWPEEATRVVFEVDDDMVEATTKMTDYVRMRLDILGLTMKSVRLESHVNPLPERDDTGGTADVTIDAWPDMLEIVDYKNGSGVFVPVEGNEQLRSYGLGALHEAGTDDYNTVKYTICQPRHHEAPEDGIMSEEVDAKVLMNEWTPWLKAAAERVDEARILMAAGGTFEELYDEGFVSVGKDGSHCTWCPLIDTCPAARAWAQELAGQEFDDDPGEMEVPSGVNHFTMLLPWIPFIDKWTAAIKAGAERLALAGTKIPEHKLIRGKSNRRWASKPEDEIAASLVDDYGLDEDNIYTKRKLITGPQAEKLVPKERKVEFNKDLLFKPEGALKLVHESDEHDEVEVDLSEDFPELED